MTDGPFESNAGGFTTRHTDAVTAPDGSVYIANNAAIEPEHIVPHESVHVLKRTKNPAYDDFYEALYANLRHGNPEYTAVANTINQAHYGNELDVSDPDTIRPIFTELTAYIHEWLANDPDHARDTFAGMFENWDAVVEADRALTEALERRGGFTASSDGQTIDTRTGEAVNIREVATTDGGKMTLRLENGRTVDAWDVAYATADEALLYETVADMGVNAATANALIRGYDPADGVEARVYALGMEEAYRYGKYGIPMQEMSRDGFSAELTESQRQLAYDLGRTDGKYQALQNRGANDRMGTKGDVRNGREVGRPDYIGTNQSLSRDGAADRSGSSEGNAGLSELGDAQTGAPETGNGVLREKGGSKNRIFQQNESVHGGFLGDPAGRGRANRAGKADFERDRTSVAGGTGQRSGISGVVEADDGRSESTSVTVSAGTESGEVKFTSVKAERYSKKQKRDSQTGASYGYDVRYVPRGSILTFGDESMVMDRVAFVLPGTNTIFAMDGTRADYIYHELFHQFLEKGSVDAKPLFNKISDAVLSESAAYEQYKKRAPHFYKQVSPELIFEEIACDLCEYAMSGSEQMRARLDGLFAPGELEKLAEQARAVFDANRVSQEADESQRQLAYNLGRTDGKYQALQNRGANDRMGTKGDVRNGREGQESEAVLRGDTVREDGDPRGRDHEADREMFGGEATEVSRGRAETQESFQRRANQENARAEQAGRRLSRLTVERHGNALIAYRVAEKVDPSSEAGKAARAFKRYGIRVVMTDGAFETNHNGTTNRHADAVTAPNGVIYIASNTTIPAEQIVAHESVHVLDRIGDSAYGDFYDAVYDQVRHGTAEYNEVAEQINRAHFNGKYDVLDVDSIGSIFTELTAYIHEFLATDPQRASELFSGAFENWDAVVEADRALTEALERRGTTEPAKTTGKLHFDGDRSALSARQETSLNALEVVADALGLDIYVYESGTDGSGRRTGANGWYDPKDSSIHLDLYAGANGEGTMLFTAAHELTHFIRQWSPEKFKTFADFLFSEYGKKGVSVDALIRAQMEKAKRSGRTIDYDTAYEEVVADSCETMFADGSLVERLARLKAADKTLWQKIKDFIDRLVSKIHKAYAGLSPDSAEGKYVARMQDAAERLQTLFGEALEDAGAAHAGNRGQKNTAANGDVKYSIRYTTDNRPVAVIDENILEGVPRAEWINKVKQTISEKFSDGIPVGGRLVRVNLKTRNEYTKSKDSQKLEIRAPIIYQDKFQSAGNLDEIVLASTNYVNEDLKHERKDNFKEFARGDVLIRVGEKDYSAQVIIGFTTGNQMVLYDVINFTPTNIKLRTKKEGTQFAAQSQNREQSSSNVPSNTTVSQTDTGVNNQSMREDAKYSDRDYSYEALTSKPDMMVTTLPADVPKNRADVVHAAKQNAAAVGKTNRDGSVTVHVKDIGTDVILSTGGLKHGLDRRFEENAIVTLEAGKILQNSVKINELTPSRREADSSYILIGAAKTESGNLYIVRSVVNRFSNQLVSMDVLYAINAKKEPAALLPEITDKAATRTGSSRNRLRSMRPGFQGPVTDSTLSISKLLDYVNEYFPDILPEDVLRHYGHEARPAGRLGESALFSARDPEGSVSNRSLLAGALESAAQNDIERQRLKDYRQKIDAINAEEAKLSAIRAKIRELSFAKGPRDTAQIKQLRDSATRIANRINTFDRQLLRLEASAPLQNVLQREKQRAERRAEQRGKEALSAYREAAQAKQQAIVERYRQARQKGIESRNKTALRGKIKGIVSELNRLLLHGTKDKHVMSGLQKTTAAALSAVNMDTVNAEKRLAEIQARIDKATDPAVIARLQETYARVERQGENMKKRLDALRDAYADIRNSPDPLLAGAHEPEIAERIDALREMAGDTPLREMSLEQLEEVYDTYKMVLTTIRNANRAFKAGREESIAALGGRVMAEVREAGGVHDKRLKALEGARSFDWSNLKPVYAFKRIGSPTLSALFNEVRAGEDVWAVDVNEAKAFFREQAKKYGYDDWDFRARHTFRSKTGREVSLSLDQMLSLYAYSKREQAMRHLEKGGFVLDDAVEVVEKKKGIPVKYKVNTAEAYSLSAEGIAEIAGALTEEQRAFADAMQAYLSDVMGAKGNEVSQEMYGVPLFKEKAYFPLKSARQYLFEENQPAGEVRLKNAGFAKETTARAGNPIILGNFMDVWSKHVNDMAMYHAFVLPLEDFNRVFNYKTAAQDTDTASVKGVLQNAYGSQPARYIGRLLTDLNGGARTDPVENLAGRLIGRFKKMAVFASLSVVIQQPSAIARAAAYIDPKYFATNPGLRGHSALWEEVKRYAPVALIKEMGYFDTNVGRRTTDWITAREYEGFREKARALVTDSGFRDEALSKAPALADELAWCYVWNAVKKETAATTDLQPGSEAFLKKAGERFTEVIVNTQVYDSVLSRSEMMRSKGALAKMATAFMAEPTTSLNMIADALLQGRRGNKRFAGRAIGAVVSSLILNAILVSFVYAGRDDDEDKTYAEKYAGTLVEELLDSVNPLTMIPFVRDIVSICQGYDVERSDMAVFTDLYNAWNKLSSDKLSPYRKAEDFGGAVAALFGLPVKNIMRDVRGIYNTVRAFLSGEETTGAGLKEAVREALPGQKAKSDGQLLYEAMTAGDTAQAARIRERFANAEAAESALRTALRENDPRIREAAACHLEGDVSGRVEIITDIKAEGVFSQDTLVAAVNNEVSAFKREIEKAAQAAREGDTAGRDRAVNGLLNKGYSRALIAQYLDETPDDVPQAEDEAEPETPLYTAADINTAFANGDTETAKAIIDELIDAKADESLADEDFREKYTGKTTKYIREQAEKKAKSSIRSAMTSYWKPLYKAAYADKDNSEMRRIREILLASGVYGRAGEVADTVQGWIKSE